MSRRKGSNPRRKDSDFERNGKLLVSRDSITNSSGDSEKKLFDPRSDNPIAFNKQQHKNEVDYDLIDRKTQPRQHVVTTTVPTSSPKREKPNVESDSSSRRPPPASGRRLWSADESSTTQLAPSRRADKPNSRKSVSSINKTPVNKKPQATSILSSSPATATAAAEVVNRQNYTDTPLSEKDTEKETKRKKLKELISSLKMIEAKIEEVSATSLSLSCFSENNKNSQQAMSHDRRGDRKINDSQEQSVIVEQDIVDVEKIWKEKIDLHLSLGEKYLEILMYDHDYAEKKGLETLCWKRAVYSLVDQFRNALRKSASDIAALDAVSSVAKTNKTQSELASMLFQDEDDSDGNSVAEIPVIHEGGGMTFIKVEKPKLEETKLNDSRLHLKQARVILSLFLRYLELADDFYLKLTLFLKSVDNESNEDMDRYLNLWRRTRKYKWYTCILLRGDIARYRWAYTPLSEGISELFLNKEEQEKEGPVTIWTKEEAFNEAWRFYSIGTWLMPAKGNLYFNLSLLLQQQPHIHTQGQDFHKLYFSTRSLMVRRNGFLNARESMLALFEGNRRWVQKNIESSKTSNSLNQKAKRTKGSKMNVKLDKNVTIPALFVRLHGMLFTKIGLDEFPRIKRIFFETLFEINHTQSKQNGFDQPIVLDNQMLKPALQDPKRLSETHLFWLETVIVCLSSLYRYDFANSKFTKLLSCNSAIRFHLDTSDGQLYQKLAEEAGDSVLFSHEIDLTCQIAVELLRRYLDPLLPSPLVPQLPRLPHVALNYADNEAFLFGPVLDQDKNRIHKTTTDNEEQDLSNDDADGYAWLVYIELLLHWMVLNGICIRSKEQASLWETIVGDIGYDFIFPQGKRLTAANENRSSKISPAFWPLLLQFLNKLLSELPTDDKYDMVNKHLLAEEEEERGGKTPSGTKYSDLEYEFTKQILSILGKTPDLPEEGLLRGLGWVDEIHGRFLKLEPDTRNLVKSTSIDTNTIFRRKLKILDYGFTLVKHLDDILYYDPVEEIFTVSKSVEERAVVLANGVANNTQKLEQQQSINGLYDEIPDNSNDNDGSDEDPLINAATIAEMDDDVLLSNETDFDDQNEGDDFMTQLKKRREQLQSIVVSTEAEERFGYRRLPARVKEREARLNYLRDCIIPGKTILVLDTNCFIGHLDLVKKLLKCQKWSIIVPLVVVTELDGLRTNTHRLGLMAQQGIELLETTLAAKPKQSTSLRIQTSHNNFMSDISIRSEQFVFGESDKNLDDLILSSCLWWISQQNSCPSQQNASDKTVSVCLVTGDRNLSVKARARDVEVVPVSAIIQLTPK